LSGAPAWRRCRRGALLAAAAAAAGASPAGAQARASERASVSQTIAGTEITIRYDRPSMRGRDSIFGAQVRWGAIWTPGANSVTTLATSRRLQLNGVTVEPGHYGLWMEVRRDSAWLLHLHLDTARWHLPPPAAGDMLLSIPARPRAADAFRETLAWEFERVRADGAQLRLWWGRTLVPFELAVESAVRATVEEATAGRYEGSWTETSARDSTRRYEVRIGYDRATRFLTSSGVPDELPSEHGATWGIALIPRGEDLFAISYTLNGEVAQAGAPGQQILLEFTISGGVATHYVKRDGRDRIIARGVRAAPRPM
jgi:hypothetical protein